MIEIRNLSIGYDGKVLLSIPSLDIPDGKLVAILGRNGTGKSTFLRTLASLQKPLSGSISYDGLATSRMTDLQRASKVAIVTTSRVRVPAFSVRDFVALGRTPYTDWIGRLSSEDVALVDRAVSLTSLGTLSDRSLDSLSDGECQKVMLARAIAQETPCVLLDEPTSFLDYPNKRQIVSLLKKVAAGSFDEKKCTVIFSTHDIALALEYCDSILLVNEGNMEFWENSQAARNRVWRLLDSER